MPPSHTASFREVLRSKLSPVERKQAIYSFDVLGDMALIEIPHSLAAKKKIIGQTLLQTNPRLTKVFEKVGEHAGKFRVEKIRWICGEKNPEVVYKEWGCLFRVNPGKVFFNPRLGTERQRIAKSVKKKQNVVIFFGGVGVYAILIAKHAQPGKVATIEWNPAAKKYVEENVFRNKVNEKVIPIQGDVKKIPPLGTCDHVIMPAPETALEYLDAASRWISKNGLIHTYLFIPSSDWVEVAKEKIMGALKKAGLRGKIVYIHKVSDFSPGKKQVCVGIRLVS